MDIRKTRTILLNQGDPPSKRCEIRDYFHATYDIDEKLLEMLAGEKAFYLRADPLRHPLIFYFGHTATFYINKLIIAGIIKQRINPAFESSFAVGVDEMSWDDLTESHYNWPRVDEVKAYRDKVRRQVDQLIQTMELTMPINWSNPWWVIMMGIEHARIHLETSSVLIRQLPLEQVRLHEFWPVCRQSGPAPQNRLLEVAGGSVRLGKGKDHPLYGWDNEFGLHTAEVESFKASQYLVSNQEYLEFVEDKGYQNRRWWTEEGWNWRSWKKAEHPLFWRRTGDRWQLRLVAEMVDLPWNWPVEVNYLEAKAFCNWKSAKMGRPIRLPAEDEWYRLRDSYIADDQPGWKVAPGNINLEHYCSPCPVDEFACGPFYDVIGNVWQWTEMPTYPFDGFEVHPFYDDFTTPTFDNQHNLIKGGSWISTGNEATRDSRYAFRRHFFQHAGFRYIETTTPVVISHIPYEAEPEVCQACDLHYGQDYLGQGNFPARCAALCLEQMGNRPLRRALEIGCGPGRACFELAREFDHVTGLDLTARTMRMGDELKRTGRIRYTLMEEGDLETWHEKTVEEFGFETVRGRVEFYQADPCNLKQKDIFKDYDLVLASDILTRLYEPRLFLTTIHEQMNRGGLLVVVMAGDWKGGGADKANWIGGYRKDGEPCYTQAALGELLQANFRPVGKVMELPRVRRLTARQFSYDLARISVWEKR